MIAIFKIILKTIIFFGQYTENNHLELYNMSFENNIYPVF